MARIIGATSATLTPGQWALGRLGVAVGPLLAGGLVLDGRAPLAEAPGGVVVRLWILGEGTPAHREVPAGPVVLDAPGAVALDLATARAAALAEVAAYHASAATVTLEDGITYAIGEDAQRSWSALLHARDTASKLGAPTTWPIPFVAADGTVVDLDDITEVRTLYLTLFAAGDALRRRAMTAQWAVAGAASVADVIAALRDFRGGK